MSGWAHCTMRVDNNPCERTATHYVDMTCPTDKNERWTHPMCDGHITQLSAHYDEHGRRPGITTQLIGHS